MSLQLKPLSLKEANEYVKDRHRHHKPTQGHKFSIGVTVDDVLVGVAIVGRPVARMLNDGYTAEVTRVCTDGTKNACSFLYSACARACKAMGYKRVRTYTLTDEPGTSLLAAGWTLLGVSAGGSWSRDSRTRQDKHPLGEKFIWQKVL